MELNTGRLFHYFNPENTRRFRHLFQHRCLLCGGGSDERHNGFCRGCKADLPWIDSQCKTCGLPLSEAAHQLQCGRCLITPPPFHLAITPLYYRKPLSRLITGFKYRNNLAHGKALGHLLMQEIVDSYLDEILPDLIIPVPLHWQRFFWRGYNQSAELGKHLAQGLGIPCQLDIVQRQRKTKNQQGLSREERLHNLKGAFRIKDPHNTQIAGRRIALLDDVVTTGSTAAAAAHLLLEYGATEIHLWAVARTPAGT